MRRLLLMAFNVILIVGVFYLFMKENSPKREKSSSAGEVKGQTNFHSSFGLKLKTPDHWYIYSKDEIIEITRNGFHFPIYDSSQRKVWHEHHHAPPKVLLMMSAHKKGTRGLGNTFFYIWTEKQSDYPEIFKNGAEFLAFNRKIMKTKFTIIKKIIGQKVDIGGKQFYYDEEDFKNNVKNYTYRRYARKWGKSFLVIVAPSTQYAEMTTVNNCLKSIRFD